MWESNRLFAIFGIFWEKNIASENSDFLFCRPTSELVGIHAAMAPVRRGGESSYARRFPSLSPLSSPNHNGRAGPVFSMKCGLVSTVMTELSGGSKMFKVGGLFCVYF